MGFFRQEYWGRLPFSTPGVFLTQGLNSYLLLCKPILYLLAIREASYVDYYKWNIIITIIIFCNMNSFSGIDELNTDITNTWENKNSQ